VTAPPREATRRRVVEWEDPVASASAAAGLSGLEALRALEDGRIADPPIALLLGFELVEFDDGRAVFAVEPGEHHYNPIGVVHGGLAATLMDSAMGCAVQTTLPAGVVYSTLELKVNLVRAITRDTGRVVCEGTIVHRGRTVATAEGRAWVQETGKLVAHGTTTCLVTPV